jgi:hypothetical protein
LSKVHFRDLGFQSNGARKSSKNASTKTLGEKSSTEILERPLGSKDY